MDRPKTAEEIRKRIALLAIRAGDLQAVPAVVTRALKYIDDPGSSISQLSSILNTDQTIAGRLIGLANSAVFSGTRRFVTVREAVIRLGYKNVRDLLFAIVVSGLARSPSKLYGLGPEQLWQHSLATALAARLIAEDTGATDPERSYVAGLLHDVGRAVLDRSLTPAEIFAIRGLVEKKSVSFQAAEKELLGFTHSEVGAHRLEKWGVGPELVEAVAGHHRPRPSSLSATVHAADVLAARAMGLGGNGPGWDYNFEPGAVESLRSHVATTPDGDDPLEILVGRIRTGLSAMSGAV